MKAISIFILSTLCVVFSYTASSQTTTVPEFDNLRLDTINIRPVWEKGYEGTGIAVAIMEIGVGTRNETLTGFPIFPYLEGRVFEEACFLGAASCGNNNPTEIGNFRSGEATCTSPFASINCSHAAGTTSRALARGSSIDDHFNGTARNSSIIALQTASHTGLEHIRLFTDNPNIPNPPQIASISMSFGSGNNFGNPFTDICDISNGAFEVAVTELKERGIAVIAAVGNNGAGAGKGVTDGLLRPACISNVISVSGTSNDGTMVMPGSNFASFLDLLAPSQIFTQTGTTDQDNQPLIIPDPVDSATSNAAPQVAGAFAVLKEALLDERPDTPKNQIVDEILEALIITGKPLAHPNGDQTIKKPLINVCAAYNHLRPDDPADCGGKAVVVLPGSDGSFRVLPID